MGEFWAAIAGAVVGGIIAFVIQLVALRAASNERKADAAARQKALAHALVFKLIRIYSHLRLYNLHLSEATKRARGALNWQAVLPIANSPDRVHFTTDEMVMLLALKDDDIFNDLVEMDERHNATIAAFDTYRDHRLTFTSLLPSEMHGNVGTIELTDDQMRVLGPKMVELNMLLAQLSAISQQQEREAWNILGRLRELLMSKVGLAISLAEKPADELLSRSKSASVRQ